MDGFGANHAGDMIPSDGNRLANQLARVYAADDTKFKDAIAFIVDNHEANLVHMRGDHHPDAI